MTVRYLIKLEPDDNDTLLVTCPALPEVTTFGDDVLQMVSIFPHRQHARAGGPSPCLS